MLAGRDRVDYEYEIDNIDDFEKGGTTSASDSANNYTAVFMIPDIAGIIYSGRGRRRRRVLSVRREDGDDRYNIDGGNSGI